jgi:hypothetical protein
MVTRRDVSPALADVEAPPKQRDALTSRRSGRTPATAWHRRSDMNRRLLWASAAAPLALMFVLAGCGKSGNDGDKVASVSGTASASASTSATLSPAEEQERALKFAQCMREHGVDMPDPVMEDGKIRIQMNVKPGVDVDAAQAACKQYAPNGGPGGGKIDQAAQANMLKYAQCMRENGVEKFPDPDPNQGGMRIEGDIANDPDFEKAQKACEQYMNLGSPQVKESK